MNDSKRDARKADAYGCGCADGPETVDEVLQQLPRTCGAHGVEWSPDLEPARD